ncbi:hypothetical protein JW926_17745 [Candidatus Sumerlaeota bacterium]|nr:hypothetical protein [Candidatus Sumerlaeota bacterium]
MSKKKRYVYFSPDAGSSVIESQVIDHLRLIKESDSGIIFDLILLARKTKNSIPPFFEEQRKPQIEREIGGRFIARLFSSTFTGFFLSLFLLFRYTFPVCFTRSLVIQGRSRNGAFIGAIFKWLCLGRTSLIFDMRGELFSEFTERMEASKSLLLKYFHWLLMGSIKAIHWFNLFSASRILYVTNDLRNMVEKDYSFAKKRFGGIFPCLSDKSKFFYDSSLRQKIRSRLNLSKDQLVLVYVGSIKWYQCVQEMMELFHLCLKADSRICFLFITHKRHHDKVRKTLAHIAPDTHYRILQAPHSEVCNYYNASDLGLLLRRPSPVNYCAAPTKFAEYLMCGLPVCLTTGIGDYSKLVEREKLGVIGEDLDQLEPLAEKCVCYLKQFPGQEERERISLVAQRHLDRKARIPEYIALYQSL